MGQYTDGATKVINGVTYTRQGGMWHPSAATPLTAPSPMAAADFTGKQLGNQRTAQEIHQAEATADANTAKAKAEAQSATLAAKQAQEQWNTNHPQADGTQNLSGPAYLQYLQKSDPGRAAYIQGLAEGRVPFPGPQMMRSPAGMALLNQVMRADPTIDATNYQTRAAARKNAATGTLSQSDNALVTAIGHAARLHSLVPDVFGSKVTPFNSVANAVDSSLLGGKQPTYDQNAQLLGDEVAKAYGGGAASDRSGAAGQFSSSLATGQKNDNIRGAIDLMLSKLAANRAQFAYGNGQLGKPDFMLLPPNVRDELQQAGASDLAKKYFEGVPIAGGGNVGGPGGPTGGGDVPPPVMPTGGADYSSLVGGPGAAVATMDPNSKLGAFKQTYRNAYDPVMASTLSAFIRHGADYDTVSNYAQSHGFEAPDPKSYAAALAYQHQHPNATPNVDAEKSVPTTLGERLSSSPLAAGIVGAGSGATAGLGDVLGRSLAGPQWDANTAALAATNPTADLVGNAVGGAAGMFAGGSLAGGLLRSGAKGGLGRNALALAIKNPVKAGALGDAAYGGIYGASETPDNPLAGAGIGALTGGVGGFGGAAATKGLGATLNGVVDPAVQRLNAAGIPLTVGETLGGGWKKAQDAMTSVFGPGNMVARRYADGREALNKVAFNTAGNIVGTPINSVGQQGIQALDQAKSQAYSNALNPISLDLTTPHFQGMRQSLDSAAQAIPDVKDAQGLATSGLQTYIDGPAQNGIMSGRDFQEGYRGLSRLSQQPDTQPYGHEIGQVAQGGKLALAAALQAQHPGAYDDFLNANSANRHLNVLANAVNAAKNQIGDNGEPLFTPAQLGQAATQNARTYSGNIAAASGQRPFNQLATDAQQVMSSKLPESGTFPRQLMGLALTGGVAGTGGMFGGEANGGTGAAEGAITPLAALSLLGTRRGQKLLTGGLLNRTAADRFTAQMLMRNPQVGGDILTASSLPLLTRP